MDRTATTPLKPAEAAQMLNVSRTSIYRMVGLEWVEYQASGVKPIRRIARESVERLLQRRRDG
jgi:hypothetical protein